MAQSLDYSAYIMAAYAVAGLILLGLVLHTLRARANARRRAHALSPREE